MSQPVLDKVQQYLASANAAEEHAAQADDPQLKASFEGIARVYREMAERARQLEEDEDKTIER
jgi:hypothetical protein